MQAAQNTPYTLYQSLAICEYSKKIYYPLTFFSIKHIKIGEDENIKDENLTLEKI